MGLVLLILLILVLIGSAPIYPYSLRWGFGPSGLVGVVLVLLFVHVIPWTGFTPLLSQP